MAKVLIISRCAWNLYNFRRGLMRAVRERGHEVKGVAARRDGFESKLETLGLPFLPLPPDRESINPLADLQVLWALYRHYRRERPNVVHHYTIKPVIYGTLAARLAGVPRVVNTVTGLGYAFSESASPWLRRAVAGLYRFSLRFAHFVFFQNEDDRRLFVRQRIVDEGRTGVVPGSGVDTSEFSPDAPAGEGPRTGPVTFLMIARLLRDKGVYEYEQAARLVRGKFPDTRFLLVGRRDEYNPAVVPRADLESWQAEGVVRWLGEVTDVRGVLREADVVVLPSYREGTPRSLLEAAAMGKPVITTDAVGCRDTVDDGVTGILVPVQDAPALAGAMERLITQPRTRVRMGLAGREKVVREFDEEIVIERALRAYGVG